MAELREPNETHLGLSLDKSQGRGLGELSAVDVWKALEKSEAVKSGLLEDLEDTILMVEGIAEDIISDMVTNIIRQPLINYTQGICKELGIPLQQGLNSGPMWEPEQKRWFSEFVELPFTNPGGKLLLVPKKIIRRKMEYDYYEYYQHFLLEFLQRYELSVNSELVQLLKNGKKRVTKKSLVEKYGHGKGVVVRETLDHPEILQQYRNAKNQSPKIPLSHLEIADVIRDEPPNWDELIKNVKNIEPGREQSSVFENAVEQLLTALFYPKLANPIIQHSIHDGRKRIDITYTNADTHGFFWWLRTNYSAAHILVECKNYNGEVGNPELDQLAGRFSPSCGQVGLLVCRHFDNKELFITRCKDTALDQRGFIIPLDDEDLLVLVNTIRTESFINSFGLLKERFNRLIM